MNFLHQALSAIPEAAKSPFAFVAYIAAIIAWIVVSIRVTRNNNLLKSIGALPAKARLQALQAEMGHVPITGGMSAEQYLRSKLHRYYFIAFLVVCLVVVVLVVVASVQSGGSRQTPPAVSNGGFTPIDISLGCSHDTLPITVAVGETARLFGLNESFSKARPDVIFLEAPNAGSSPLLWPELPRVEEPESGVKAGVSRS